MVPCSWHFEHRANEWHVCGWVCVCKIQQSGGPMLLCAVGGPACLYACMCVCVLCCKGGGLFLILEGNFFFAQLLYVHGGG